MLRLILAGLAAIAIAIAVSIFTPFGASAASQCGPHADVISVLAKNYQETQSATGVTANGALIEVFTSEGGRTWSIVVTSPDGLSCLVAAGDGWQTTRPVSPGEAS